MVVIAELSPVAVSQLRSGQVALESFQENRKRRVFYLWSVELAESPYPILAQSYKG